MNRRFASKVTLITALLVCASVSSAGAVSEIRIGLVVDGPDTPASRAELRDLVLDEVVKLMAGEFEVSFPADKILVADDTVPGIESALDQLLRDPQVDLVLSGGPISSHLAANRSSLPKAGHRTIDHGSQTTGDSSDRAGQRRPEPELYHLSGQHPEHPWPLP